MFIDLAFQMTKYFVVLNHIISLILIMYDARMYNDMYVVCVLPIKCCVLHNVVLYSDSVLMSVLLYLVMKFVKKICCFPTDVKAVIESLGIYGTPEGIYGFQTSFYELRFTDFSMYEL